MDCKEQKTIGYVILTWNSEKQIIPCLKSIFEIKKYTHNVIIIDNGSNDATIKKINDYKNKNKSKNINVDIIKLSKNFGTTVSRNIGIKKLENIVDYICILDSDTIINQLAIDVMIKNLNNNYNIAIIGPGMKDKNGNIQYSYKKFPNLMIKLYKACPLKKIQKCGEKMEYIDISEKKDFFNVDYLISACWMLRSNIIKKIGYLDEKIFYAPEDVDYCMRAHLMGYIIAYTNEAYIIHDWQRLSKKKFFSKINWEHVKGLIYYFKKYKYLFNPKKASFK